MFLLEMCESVVAQWLAHLPLVLEVPGSIPARGEENFGVRTRFLQVGNTSILICYSSIDLK